MHGLEVHVLDRVTSGNKPDLVKALGATYHSTNVAERRLRAGHHYRVHRGWTGHCRMRFNNVGSGGIVCLTGVGTGGVAGGAAIADVAAAVVLKNNVVVGSVNANKRHWYKAGVALARADRKWLERLITRREKPENFKQALDRKPDDIKVIIQFSDI